MIAFLYAFLIGGLVAAVGGGSSGGSTASAAPPEPEPLPPAPADPPAPASPPLDEGDEPPVEPGEPGASDIPSLPDSAYDIGWAGLSPEEQLIVELINRARLDPLGEVSRLGEGLASGVTSSPSAALAVDPILSISARGHSQDMDNRDFFNHTNPDGDGPGARAIDDGYGSGFVGENIGWIGSSFTPSNIQARAEAHHANLWESDGHQRNLMDEDWTKIGVGYDYGDYLGYNGSTFVTEVFGAGGGNYLTGVVIDDDDSDGFYDIGEGQGDVRITAFDGEDTFATATWDAGGYTLALPPGTYQIVFEGGDLDTPYETEVTITDENVKLDVIEGETVLAGTVADDLLSALTLPDGPMPAVVEEELDQADLMLA